MQTFVEEVKRSLSEQESSLSWQRVTVPGLSVAWVGLHVPSVDTGGRPWVWEVVTPHQYRQSERLQNDPLVLSVPHDIVIAEIGNVQRTEPLLRMQIEVRDAPQHLFLPNTLSTSYPWTVRLETGWTVNALCEAAQRWINEETDGRARLMAPVAPESPHQHYQLHPDIKIESAAFDCLLTLDPDDAATVTHLLTQVHEALQPYR